MVFKRTIHMFIISLPSWSLGAADAGAPGRITPRPMERPAESPPLSDWRELARRSATEQDGGKEDWEALLAQAYTDYIDALENDLEDLAQDANNRIQKITLILNRLEK
jgi:hypothetical protein